jgi:hypothetical protein
MGSVLHAIINVHNRMDQSSIMATIAIIVSVGGTVIAAVNHRRVRSSCCGRKLEASIDIENTTPQNSALHVDAPGKGELPA